MKVNMLQLITSLSSFALVLCGRPCLTTMMTQTAVNDNVLFYLRQTFSVVFFFFFSNKLLPVNPLVANISSHCSWFVTDTWRRKSQDNEEMKTQQAEEWGNKLQNKSCLFFFWVQHLSSLPILQNCFFYNFLVWKCTWTFVSLFPVHSLVVIIVLIISTFHDLAQSFSFWFLKISNHLHYNMISISTKKY